MKNVEKNIASLMLSVFALLLLVVGFYFQSPKTTEADTLTTSATVGNVNPTATSVNVNNGSAMTLTENTTVNFNVTGTISDDNGCSDITGVAARVYASNLDATCTANANSCYTVTCSTSGCSGGSDTSAVATCAVTIWFHANAENWKASIVVTDAQSGTGSGASGNVAVNSLVALMAPASIAYGTVNPGGNTAANQATGVTTTGNVAIDNSVKGTALTSASSNGTVTVDKQKYGLTDVAYASLTYNLALADAALELASTKPTAHPSDQIDIIYWGLGVDAGTPYGADYSGTNTLTPATD